jgi:hypothetical protein
MTDENDDTYTCREGHYHDGPVKGQRGRDGQMCPEEMVNELIVGGMTYDEAVEEVYG